ncbi:hypothetical protein NIES4071_64820 [Calothrix sp. NIES-4071]|nr:hypothetical protein NIES4071_64820 [Calothrix sp. NIES-4071]BAZ60786.1 hypothetical protein NIES4105_64780 [Calothrix sp. NIES-4105]
MTELKLESKKLLLQQLASTDAFVWLTYDAHEAAQTLSELLSAAKQSKLLKISGCNK